MQTPLSLYADRVFVLCVCRLLPSLGFFLQPALSAYDLQLCRGGDEDGDSQGKHSRMYTCIAPAAATASK